MLQFKEFTKFHLSWFSPYGSLKDKNLSSVGKTYTCGPQTFGNIFTQDIFFWKISMGMYIRNEFSSFSFFSCVQSCCFFLSKTLKMYLWLKMDLGKIYSSYISNWGIFFINLKFLKSDKEGLKKKQGKMWITSLECPRN